MTTDATERSEGSLPATPQGAEEEVPWLDELTPRQIVGELDKYIVGQADAKKAVGQRGVLSKPVAERLTKQLAYALQRHKTCGCKVSLKGALRTAHARD